jgi:hypothetical protein
MQSHPPKALFVPMLALLGMALVHAATLHAYTSDTENKAGYNTGYSAGDNAESSSPYNTDAKSSYGTGPITPLIGPPDEPPIGPAAVFHRALQALSRKSDSQTERIGELRAAVPGVLPDLYRVFLVL